MKKKIKAHEESSVKTKSSAPEPSSTPLPAYLLDRDRGRENEAKKLSSSIKERRNEKAAKFSVPLPKVRGISEEEMFKVVKTGAKTKKKGWKRMVTKPTFGMCLLLPSLPLYTSTFLSTRLCLSQSFVHGLGSRNADMCVCVQWDPTSPGGLPNTSDSSGPWASATRKRTSRTRN